MGGEDREDWRDRQGFMVCLFQAPMISRLLQEVRRALLQVKGLEHTHPWRMPVVPDRDNTQVPGTLLLKGMLEYTPLSVWRCCRIRELEPA